MAKTGHKGQRLLSLSDKAMNNAGSVSRRMSSLREPTFFLGGTDMSDSKEKRFSCPKQVLMRLSEGLPKRVKLLPETIARCSSSCHGQRCIPKDKSQSQSQGH